MKRIADVLYSGNNRQLFERVNVTDLDAGARVIVPDTHAAILIKDGQMMDTLPAGPHNIFESRDGKKTGSINVEVIWISRTYKLKLNWGTASSFSFRDRETDESFSARAYGEYEVKIANPRKFYLELIGSEGSYTAEMLYDRLLGRLLSAIEPAIAREIGERSLTFETMTQNCDSIAAGIMPALSQMLEREYGLTLCSFVIRSIGIPEEDRARILAARRQAADEKKAERELSLREEREEKARLDAISDEERREARAWEREKYMRDKHSEDLAMELETSKAIGWRPQGGQAGRFCPDCGAQLAAGAKFCSGCGKPLASEKKKCPACGRELPPDSRFCFACGSKL